MNRVVFFWNDRMDGGVHIGLEANGVLLFDELKEGQEAPDPSLNWFVDISCETQAMPGDADQIREWFLKLAPQINKALDALIEKLEVGIDGSLSPFSHRLNVKGHLGTFTLDIKGSALKRIRATEVAGYLREVKKRWQKELRRLTAQSPTNV